MKYLFIRKINPKRFFPHMIFESVDFGVSEVENRKKAVKEVNEWIEEWIKETQKKIDKQKEKELGSEFTKQGSLLINNKK